ncbi:MAG: IS630 family transposase [Planctomycetaceae bacterium]|nr:IS630 family transposase [Planctomycetaceae bacterium]
MLRIFYSASDLATIQHDRYYHPDPHIMKRMTILALHSEGETIARIARLTGLNIKTVSRCLHRYMTGGLDAVYQYNKYKRRSELEDHCDTIEKDFDQNPPHTVNEARDRIEKLTGIRRSLTQVRQFLKKKGFRCLKTGSLPAKLDTEAQKEFLNNQLEPVISQAQDEEVSLFFMDAAHFVLGSFLCYLWSRVRFFVPTPSGRQRYNVLGAYNAITGVLEAITNTTYINSNTVCEMLQMLAKKYVGKKIVIVLDNAAYQRCKLVTNLAESLGIELMFLPSYSPNLNLIERYWKLLKKKILYNHYYKNFDDFKKAIDECLKNRNKKYKKELKSLMTFNFQSFENVPIHAV